MNEDQIIVHEEEIEYEDEMSEIINNANDQFILEVLTKIELNEDQDAFLRYLLRGFYLEAYEEGAEEGYEEGFSDGQYTVMESL